MDRETLTAVYTVVIVIDFVMTASILIGYTVLAPWHKYAVGRQIAGLLFSLTLLFGVSVVRLFFRGLPFLGEIMLGMVILLTVAIGFLGYGIYSVQIKKYLKKRALKKRLTAIQNRSQNTMTGGNSPEVNNHDGN